MNKLQIGSFILNIFPDFEERLRDWITKSDLTEREKYVLIQRIFNEKTLEKVGKRSRRYKRAYKTDRSKRV